mmetsp:Transcript_69626/g.145454  ORF Transcript_69626/g.145454 Transcript_69626/m.145454 type:complete len:446 (+) Transcript_69626:73-1410(+)
MAAIAEQETKGNAWINALTAPASLVLYGVIVGGGIGAIFAANDLSDEWYIDCLALPGSLWMQVLQCLVLPMVIISMIQSMVSLRQLPGSRTLAFALVGLYMATTVIALTEALIIGVPYIGNLVEALPASSIEASEDYTSTVEDMTFIDALLGVFEGMTPENVINDAAQSDLLPVIITAVVFGICIKDKQEDGSLTVTLQLLSQVNDVVTTALMAVMKLAPIGVASIVFSAAVSVDIEQAGKALVFYLTGLWIAMACQVFIVYPLLLVVGGGRNPFSYYKNCIPALAMALGMSSSLATLPTTKKCADKNGIRAEVRDLALSLGATINMDGAGMGFIFQSVWLSAIQGVEFGISKVLLTGIAAFVCSVGTSPIPSSGAVALVVLKIAGVPINSTFGLVMAVEFISDRSRTMVNVLGDLSVVAVIDKHFGHSIVELEAEKKKIGQAEP